MEKIKLHNSYLTCWNCSVIYLEGKVDFRACGQSTKELAKISKVSKAYVIAEYKRKH